jgi:hypothetical protein
MATIPQNFGLIGQLKHWETSDKYINLQNFVMSETNPTQVQCTQRFEGEFVEIVSNIFVKCRLQLDLDSNYV